MWGKGLLLQRPSIQTIRPTTHALSLATPRRAEPPQMKVSKTSTTHLSKSTPVHRPAPKQNVPYTPNFQNPRWIFISKDISCDSRYPNQDNGSKRRPKPILPKQYSQSITIHLQDPWGLYLRFSPTEKMKQRCNLPRGGCSPNFAKHRKPGMWRENWRWEYASPANVDSRVWCLNQTVPKQACLEETCENLTTHSWRILLPTSPSPQCRWIQRLSLKQVQNLIHNLLDLY